MFFQWKKTKNSESKGSRKRFDRISCLVSYLRAKRESSIVVQTGFPTSVADLVVNSNISLFPLRKKQKKLKKTSRKSFEKNDLVSVSLRSLNLNPSPVLVSCGKSEPDLPHLSEELLFSSIQEKSIDVMQSKEGSVSVSNGAFWSIVKILFLVILVLGTEKLVLGITALAFMLFFLEFVGKHILIFSNPCADAQWAFRIGFWRGKGTVGFKQDQILRPSDSDPVDFVAFDPVSDGNLEAEDIDDRRNGIKEIQIPASELDLSDIKVMNQNRDVTVKHMDLDVKTTGIQKSRSQRAKIRAKLKSFVTRKFRRVKSRKGDSSASQQGDTESFCGDQILNCKMGEEEPSQKDEGEEGEEEEVGMEDIHTCSNLHQNNSQEIDVSGETACRKTKGCSEYLFFCIIVLLGLIGGRLPALVFLIGWFLTVNSIKILWRKVRIQVGISIL